MTDNILHYIFDPLCGWCYGSTPLVKTARRIPGLSVVLHAAGMMPGDNRRKINEEWRNYVIQNDKRIAAITGQIFGKPYFNELLRDNTAVMDSEPPIAAILAAEKISNRGLEMLLRIQQAHYQEGRRVIDKPVLESLAKELDLPSVEFIAEMNFNLGEITMQHIAESRALLKKVQGRGFPTFVLENANANLMMIPASNYLNDITAWKKLLTNKR